MSEELNDDVVEETSETKPVEHISSEAIEQLQAEADGMSDEDREAILEGIDEPATEEVTFVGEGHNGDTGEEPEVYGNEYTSSPSIEAGTHNFIGKVAEEGGISEDEAKSVVAEFASSMVEPTDASIIAPPAIEAGLIDHTRHPDFDKSAVAKDIQNDAVRNVVNSGAAKGINRPVIAGARRRGGKKGDAPDSLNRALPGKRTGVHKIKPEGKTNDNTKTSFKG
jgi:hypothetical protein